jgi:hypothetical protein
VSTVAPQETESVRIYLLAASGWVEWMAAFGDKLISDPTKATFVTICWRYLSCDNPGQQAKEIIVEARPNAGHEHKQKRSATQLEIIQNGSLVDRVSRMRHRWFNRVMSDPRVSPAEKCFAYFVMDKLNCVTLDAWPSQPLMAQLLGRKSIKTVNRLASSLERHGYLRVSRDTRGSCRYAPVFLPVDEDKPVPTPRQNCPPVPDKNVEESLLGILVNQSCPSEGERRASKYPSSTGSNYDRRKRGTYEAEIARLLGNDGFVILQRLSEHDDAIVERLCRACADDDLGRRELIAARLAADQLPKQRRST